ncbi:MAG: YhgE/Pip domain-containing protein, partial [Eggerthellaceae bacterium]
MAPLLIGVLVACVMSLMFYPMANMEMKGLPFAVLSLDEGVETPQGTVNAGDTIVENISSAAESEDGEDSPIAWTQVGSQEELDEALENGEFYGALIVPADFSEKQVA